jgi:hypothetical protein
LLRLLDNTARGSEQMRRGSALFLAQSGGHSAVVDLIEQSQSRGGGAAGGGNATG